MSFVICSRKTGKYLNQTFLQKVDQESCRWNSISQILILPFWLVTPPCFRVKISQILQKVIVSFPKRREKKKTSFWHILIVQLLKLFCTAAYFFLITYGENFSNFRPYWQSKGPKTSQKRLFRGCWIGTQNFGNI